MAGPAGRCYTGGVSPAEAARADRTGAAWQAFLIALVAYTATWLVTRPIPTGDEGHYLLIASSLAHDGDVDLANDYPSDALARLDPRLAAPLSPGTHAHRYRPDGPLLSTHGFGLGVLLAPVIRLGGTLTAIRLVLIVIAAVLAAEVWTLLAIVSRARAWVRWSAWSATFLTLPVVVFSNQIYAEVPGALLIAVALRRLLDRSTSFAGFCLAGLAIGGLPWLHLRFVGIAMVLGLALLLRAAVRVGPVAAGIASAIPVGVVAGMLNGFRYWYGSAWPGAIRAPMFGEATGPTLALFYDNVLSSVFSAASGWLPFAPSHCLGLVGLVMLVCWGNAAAWWSCGALVVYALTLGSSESFSNGWSYPARLLVCLIPFVALPLATALRARPVLRVAFAPLFLLSLVYTGLALRDAERLYALGSVETDLPVARDLVPIWPRFPWGVGGFAVTPDMLARLTGRLEPGGDGRPIVARAVPGEDQPGLLAYGPYVPLLDGTYRALFDVAIAASTAPADTEVARLDVATRQGEVVHATKSLRIADRNADGGFVRVEVPFTMPAARNVETRVFFDGTAEVRLAGVRVEPVGPHGRTRDWDRALLWIGGLAFAGIFFAQRRVVRGRFGP